MLLHCLSIATKACNVVRVVGSEEVLQQAIAEYVDWTTSVSASDDMLLIVKAYQYEDVHHKPATVIVRMADIDSISLIEL